VLLNLLRNAFEAMHALPQRSRVVRLRCEVDERVLRFAVIDRGVGLAAVGEHLFEPFFTTKRDGVGLGLAVCKRVIEAHGGSIAASTNEAGPGVTFTISLPRAPAQAPTHAPDGAEEEVRDA
jgi:two-component system sensor histidine kinase TtrS